MGKSVYSLVLADEVVEAVDRLAYQMNTSRSNLINQILAERVQCVTPEMRMRDIFSTIEQLMDTRFQFMAQPSDAMISIKSPLRYKYKPTIRYSVELSKDFNGKVGRLKVQFRTQSSALINAISGFFKLWQALENNYLAKLFTNGVPSIEEEGRFTRDFYSPSTSLTDEEIGNSIGEYIKLMDECIQIYFDNISDPNSQANKISEKYKNYLEKGVTVL
ncbi:MAG: CopG family transcriptional regulator [Hominimerdicola sp.]